MPSTQGRRSQRSQVPELRPDCVEKGGSALNVHAAPAHQLGSGDGWIARLLIAGVCLPFLLSGIAKLLNFGDAVAEFQHFKLPAPTLAVIATIAVQLVASLLLVFATGRLALLGALALVVFTAFATFIAHDFWNFDGPARVQQRNVFIEHVAVSFALIFIGWWKLRQTQR